MNRRIWGCVIAAALALGTLTGCNDGGGASIPMINTENPAFATAENSSTSSTTSSDTGSSVSSSTAPESAVEEKVGEVLKETLDGYEEFFKEYTKYLKDYKTADKELLQAYAAQSAEISELLERFDVSGLNSKEEIYLADVKYRISKLLDGVKDKLPEWNAENGQYEISTSSSADRPVATARPSSFSSYYQSVISSRTPEPSSSSEQPSSSEPLSEPVDTTVPVSSTEPPQTTEIYDSSVPEIMDIPAPDASSLLTDYTRKWAYDQLDPAQQTVYARFYECAKNYIEDANVSDLDLSLSDVDKAYWAFDYDNAQFLTLGSGYSYSYMPSGKIVTVGIDYGRSPGNVPSEQFEETTLAIIAQAQQTGGDYERLKYVHDWIVNNTSYISSGSVSKSEADGSVVYGQALCEGYSKAFMYLAQAMGYECVCVAGYSNGDHMWNMVKVGGSWYHVDVTWDDPLSNSGPVLRHNYFLVGDSTISADHTVDNYFPVPSAPYDYR